MLKKLFFLLSKKEKKQLTYLFVAMIGLALVEIASVGSILPFMGVVTNTEYVAENKYLSFVYNFFDFQSVKTFLVFLGFSVLALLVISNASTAIMIWLIFNYSWMRNHSISTKMFGNYLYAPYSFFLDKNTAELQKNILDEVQIIIINIIISLLMITKNIVASLFIIILLIMLDPLLAVVVLITLGGSYLLLFKYSSRVLRKIGEQRAEANKMRFRYAAEALSGIKIIKVLSREPYFLDRFSNESYIVSKSFARKAVIGQLPRYGFEVIAFGGILLIVLYFLLTQREIDQIVPVLSLYTFAGYRILPSLQTIFNKATSIRYAIPSLDILYSDLSSLQKINTDCRLKNGEDSRREKQADTLKDTSQVPANLQIGINLKEVDFSYGSGPESGLIFSSLNLFIPANTTVGFAGTTGAGKTTLVDIILGLLVARRGSLLVDNQVIGHQNVSQWQRKIGYVPQDIFLTDASIIKNIAFGVGENEIDQEAVVAVSKIANIHDFITSELPGGYETVVGERGVRLSGGQKQRIGIARALYHDPQVLILDEATSALDGVTEDSIMQAIYKLSRKKTIIIIAHRLSTLKDCDQIYLLSRGKVVAQGSYDQLIEGNRYFKEIRSLERRRAE